MCKNENKKKSVVGVILAEKEGDGFVVSKVAGRAPYLIVIEDGEIKEIASNPFKDERGAGRKLAEYLYHNAVSFIVSEDVGEEMANKLKEYNIKWFKRNGYVDDELIKDLLKNMV